MLLLRLLLAFLALAAAASAQQADPVRQLILPGAVLAPELALESESSSSQAAGSWMPLPFPAGVPSLFSLLGGGGGDESGARSFVLSPIQQQLSSSTSPSTSTSATSSSPNAKKRKPCGRHGPLGRRGGPFFSPDSFSPENESKDEPLLTMVVVGGGSPEAADTASFPLALPRENEQGGGGQGLSSSSSSLPSGNPFEVISSLVRALESAASGGGSGGTTSSPPASLSFSLSAAADSEGRDAPLAEKKTSLSDGEEEEPEDDEDEGMEQQQLQQQEEGEEENGSSDGSDDGSSNGSDDDLPEDERAWLSSFAAENAGENERALLQDELSRRLPSSFSLAAFFVDDRYLGMLGFALLCAASGAAWVATVSAVQRIGGEAGKKGLETRRELERGSDGEISSSLLEPLAGGAELEGAKTIENPFYNRVVSAADFVEK